MTLTYKHTLYASYLGYITQAIVNNLSPLLFILFQRDFSVSLEQIGLLISLNFGVQILTDFLAARYIDRIGYRRGSVLAHIFSTIGLISLGILPFLTPNPYWGLMTATILNAIGGGLIEVLVSPIVEFLPGDEKASAMSLLHSFYCWGQAGVILFSTLYFNVIGTEVWRYLPFLWAFIPFFNIFLFANVPLCTMPHQEKQVPLKTLFAKRLFLLMLILMICSGASELAMSQWSSLFAEAGLGVSKTMGDLLGPCAFAVLMGLSRMFYGIYGSKIDLKKALILSAFLCVFSYLLCVFSPIPILSLVGCALCGLSVGIMWPGTFSLTSRYYPYGGTAMFAVLALAGDMGCASGPGLVGFISNSVENGFLSFFQNWFSGNSLTETSLKTGLLFAAIFPAVLLFSVIMLKYRKK